MARNTTGPNVMLGTKRPSITSTWIQSAPAASMARTSSPNRVKSAESTDGAIRIGCMTASSTSRPPEQLLGGGDNPLGLEAELALQLLERRRGTKGLHADHAAFAPHVAVPPQHRSLLDGETSLDPGRQHLFAILFFSSRRRHTRSEERFSRNAEQSKCF